MPADKTKYSDKVATQAGKANSTALRIAWIATIAGVVTTIFDVSLAYRSMVWQLQALTVIAGGFTLVALITVLFLYKGKQGSMWLLIIAGQLAFVGASALISGLGLISLVSILVLTIMIAALSLPAGSTRLAIFLSVIMGAAAGLLDWLRPEFHMPAPAGLKYFLTGLLVLVGVIYAILIARNFRTFSLRAQLISVFIIVSSISISLVTFVSNINTQRLLNANANSRLYSAASQTAQQIDAFIQTNLNSINAEARLPALAAVLKVSPSERNNSVRATTAFQTLLALAQKDPQYITSYALLDLAGNDIIDTAREEMGENKGTRDYYYHVLETSETYVSPVQISRSTNEPSLYFSSPVWNENGVLLGVLRVRYRAEIVQKFLAETVGLAGPGSYGFLVDEYNVRLVHALKPGLQFISVVPLDADLWDHLVQARRIPADSREMFTNLPGLVAAFENSSSQPFYNGEVGELTNEQGQEPSVEQSAIVSLSTRPWKLVFSIDRAQFLNPIELQTRSNALLALLIAGFAGLGGLLLAQLLSRPITQLTNAARSIATGDLTVQAPVTSGSEMGTLATAFNAMTTQLRMTLEGLEERVHERTRELERRAVQLRAAAEVGSAVASVRVLDELLQQIIHLISERFGYYHVGIFLLDSSGEYAVLRAANSEGGKRMLARAHRLKVGEVGIVGYSVARKEPRLALDVGQDEVYYKNPDLPETRSELALPLIVGGKVLGALDVQSTQPAAFSTDVIATLQILADQVAVAIDNARLFSENQAALQAARRAYGDVRRDAWDRMLHARSEFGYIANRQDEVSPSTHNWTPEMVEASRTGDTVQSEDGSISVPIKDRDRVLGIIRLRKPPERSWSKEELELTSTITQQLFLAIESARLYQETQARAERERLASEITSQMRASNDPHTILQTAVSQLRQALQAQRAQVLVRPTPVQEENPSAPNLPGDES